MRDRSNIAQRRFRVAKPGEVPVQGDELPVRREDSGRVARFKRAYADRRRRQGLSAVPLGGLAVAMAAGGGSLPGLAGPAGSVVVGAVVLGFFGFSLVNWRCPACDAYLGQRLNPRTCPSCGQELRD